MSNDGTVLTSWVVADVETIGWVAGASKVQEERMGVRRVLREVDLVSESKRRAQYTLRLLSLAGGEGYVVAKESGAAGSTLVGESWYRETLEQAERKFEAILRQKTNRKVGRQYRQTPNAVSFNQLALFG